MMAKDGGTDSDVGVRGYGDFIVWLNGTSGTIDVH